jgi:zinc protease
VLGVLLGTGRSARLYRKIREEMQLMHDVGAGAYTPQYGGIFYAGGECDPDKRAVAQASILQEIERIKQEGVSAEEVRKAGRQFLSEQFTSLHTTRGQASDLGSNWLAAQSLDFTRHYLSRVDSVTPQQIQQAAQRYLTEENLSIVSLNPKQEGTNKHFQISKRPKTQTQEITLTNGARLLVHEERRLPVVSLRGVFRGGVLSEPDSLAGRGKLWARSLMKGAGSRDAASITQALESLGAQAGGSSGGSSCSIHAGCFAPDLEFVTGLWADILQRPHFPAEAVAAEKQRLLAAIKQDEEHISFHAGRALRQRIYGRHPFAQTQNGTPQSVGGLDCAILEKFHQEHSVGQNAVFAMFGAVSASQAQDLLEANLGRMQPGSLREPQVDHLLAPEYGTHTQHLPDKRQACLMIGFPTVDLRHADHLPLELIDEACSDMASRLFIRIREELGLAYSVGASRILGLCPGTFLFSLSTSPTQLELAQNELRGQIESLANRGLLPEELERAKKTWLGKSALSIQSVGSLAERQALDVLYGMGLEHFERTSARVKSISLDEVNAAAARYFSVSEPVIIRVIGGAED